ncbi:hypothetical protein [Nesterenkonia cremea]|uniref:Uncharacterized protein n=1 Tax=Nesterenkonia cremea TaxID=1882340 RepID=A0A917AWD7_9MICC|nr:hypothetical protein [Nesterenkonia cremea]GGE78616.1 hypothetical protein GCM10011401_27380 [Nesterenkonia cremea]
MSHGTLLISDYRSHRLFRWSLPEGGGSTKSSAGVLNEEPRPGVLAEHAGFLALPSGGRFAAAYADDLRGRLVLLGREGSLSAEVPIAIPAEHLAISDCGSFLAVTTGCGMNIEPFSDLLTLIDLRPEAPTPVRVRVRMGEPGVAVVRDDEDRLHVLLRHRGETAASGEFIGRGAVEAIPVEKILTAGPHVPQVRGAVTEDIAPDGHGDVYDPVNKSFWCSTSRGLERFVVLGGRPVAQGITAWPVAGRAFYLRIEPVSRRIWATLRGGTGDPASWAQWTNWVMSATIGPDGALTPETIPLPQGLVFRLDVAPDSASGTLISPDGDLVWIVDVGAEGLSLRQGDLAPMTYPPRPGRPPWDGGPDGSAQRRAVAVLPELEVVAVTSGGDGKVELHRRGSEGLVQTRLCRPGEELGEESLNEVLDVPLDEGGHMMWLPGTPREQVDLIGR